MGYIKGVKHWKDGDKKYRQDNNVMEEVNPEGLEYCGPESSVMIQDCMGNLPEKLQYADIKNNIEGIQPGDLLSLYMNTNTQSLIDEFQKYRALKNYPFNRVPQYYPLAVKKLFGNDCFFIGSNFLLEQKTKDKVLERFIKAKYITFSALKGFLEKGYGVQLCLKSPGHYIAAIAFDFTTNEVIFNDPWPTRSGLKNNGLHERFDETYFNENVHNYCVVYT